MSPDTRLRAWAGLTALVLVEIAALAILSRHGVHFLGLLGYAVLIALPFIYLFKRYSDVRPAPGSPSSPARDLTPARRRAIKTSTQNDHDHR